MWGVLLITNNTLPPNKRIEIPDLDLFLRWKIVD